MAGGNGGKWPRHKTQVVYNAYTWTWFDFKFCNTYLNLRKPKEATAVTTIQVQITG